jgi:hypothetical protein
MFRVYCGMCLSYEEVHSWVEERGKHFSHDEEIETTAKNFYATCFDALMKL